MRKHETHKTKRRFGMKEQTRTKGGQFDIGHPKYTTPKPGASKVTQRPMHTAESAVQPRPHDHDIPHARAVAREQPNEHAALQRRHAAEFRRRHTASVSAWPRANLTLAARPQTRCAASCAPCLVENASPRRVPRRRAA